MALFEWPPGSRILRGIKCRKTGRMTPSDAAMALGGSPPQANIYILIDE